VFGVLILGIVDCLLYFRFLRRGSQPSTNLSEKRFVELILENNNSTTHETARGSKLSNTVVNSLATRLFIHRSQGVTQTAQIVWLTESGYSTELSVTLGERNRNWDDSFQQAVSPGSSRIRR